MLVAIEKQSPDIAQGVDRGPGLYKEQGAGDQGMMFGYACDETPELMPAPIMYAHQLVARLAECARPASSASCGPTARARSPSSTRTDRPARVDTVVVSTQHVAATSSYKELSEAIIEQVIKPGHPDASCSTRTRASTSTPPAGSWSAARTGDCGLTGRKIIVDTYGGMGRHGGGAFSGKDPSKVDRSAATTRATSPRTSWPRGWPRAARSRSPTPSAWPSRSACYVDTFGTARLTRRSSPTYVLRQLRPAAQGHHRAARPPAAHLPPDGRLRPLRPAGVHLGAHGFRAEKMASDLLGRRGVAAVRKVAPEPVAAPPARGAKKAVEPEAPAVEAAPARRGGRPKKVVVEAAPVKRGRRPKAVVVVEAAPVKRGRRPKAAAVEAAPARRGGRPKKVVVPVAPAPRGRRAAKARRRRRG